MSGLSLDDGDRQELARWGVREQPDGSLRSDRGTIVEPGTAAGMLLAKGQPDPSGIRRPYITAGHASDSPANGPRGVIPEPPEGGGRSASLCTTPPDDGEPGEDSDGVEKVAPGNSGVVEPERIRRGYLWDGHAAPSPGDLGDNNPHPGGTPGHVVASTAAGDYNANVARARAEHVMPSQACTSRPAPAQYSPPAGMQANAVPTPVNPSSLTGHAPGER